RNDTHRTAQRGERQRTDVATVDSYGSRADVEEPRQQADERGLARPGAADDRHRRARGDVHPYLVQHLTALAPRIPETHAVELDLAPLERRVGRGAARSDDLGLRAEDVLESHHRRAAALQDREHPAECHRRPCEQMKVGDEGDEVADADPVAYDEPAAEPENDEDPGARHRLHDRREESAHTRERETEL